MQLEERGDIGALVDDRPPRVDHPAVVGRDPVVQGVLAGEQAGPGSSAHRHLAIGPVKQQSLPGYPVNIRRNHLRISVAIQLRAQVIHGNKKDVGLSLL